MADVHDFDLGVDAANDTLHNPHKMVGIAEIRNERDDLFARQDTPRLAARLASERRRQAIRKGGLCQATSWPLQRASAHARGAAALPTQLSRLGFDAMRSAQTPETTVMARP